MQAWARVKSDLDFKVDRYHANMFPPLRRDYFVCNRCQNPILVWAGDDTEANLRATGCNIYLVWKRLLAYIPCAELSGVYSGRVKQRETLISRRQERSAQVLLLLQEVGLPFDIAWPIAAVSCWML